MRPFDWWSIGSVEFKGPEGNAFDVGPEDENRKKFWTNRSSAHNISDSVAIPKNWTEKF
jgi:hypothetical protein